jgi:hypothetical protein
VTPNYNDSIEKHVCRVSLIDEIFVIEISYLRIPKLNYAPQAMADHRKHHNSLLTLDSICDIHEMMNGTNEIIGCLRTSPCIIRLQALSYYKLSSTRVFVNVCAFKAPPASAM